MAGEHLREGMTAMDLSPEEVARITFRRSEEGHLSIDADELNDLSERTKVEVDYLLFQVLSRRLEGHLRYRYGMEMVEGEE